MAAANFRIPFHPVTILLIGASLFLNCNSERRKFILITFAGYAHILIATLIFVVPELLAITGSTFSNSVNAELTRRAETWEMLSLVRLGPLLLLAVSLLWGRSRPGPDQSFATR